MVLESKVFDTHHDSSSKDMKDYLNKLPQRYRITQIPACMLKSSVKSHALTHEKIIKLHNL